MIRFLCLLWFIHTCNTLAGQSIAVANKCFSKPDLIDGAPVYNVVSKQPEYKGGLNEFYADFLKNIKHLNDINKIEEKVIVTFIIDTVGQVRNFCFIKPEDGRYDLQLPALAQKVNHWTPGELNNKKVGVRMLLPMIIDWSK